MEYSKAQFLQVVDMFPELADATDAQRNELYEDFVACERSLDAEPIDYLKYRFWELDDVRRSAYFTRRQYAALSAKVNDVESCAVFRDKARFVERYRALFGRGAVTPVLDGRRAFDELCACNERLVLKSTGGAYGRGITFVSTADPEALWSACMCGGVYLEEPIKQHEALGSFHPSSVNSVRVLSVADRAGCQHVVSAALRCGIAEMITDSGEGLFAAIDIASGVVCTDGRAHIGTPCECHPDSGVRFKGFEIPFFEELKAKTVEAAKLHDGVRLANWDFALDSDGCWELLEGNADGGVGPCQESLGCGLKELVLETLG
jgi:hypothetical protein